MHQWRIEDQFFLLMWPGIDGCGGRAWASCAGFITGVILFLTLMNFDIVQYKSRSVKCGFWCILFLGDFCHIHIQAAEETGRKLKVYAVEKNPNAVVTLHVSFGSFHIYDDSMNLCAIVQYNVISIFYCIW